MTFLARMIGYRSARMCGWTVKSSLLLLALTLAAPSSVMQTAAANLPRKITVEATKFALDPEHPKRVRFGKLEWRGGVILRSSAREFGGYSGLAIDRNGKRLLAISDRGTWLSAAITYKSDVIAGLEEVHIGALDVGRYSSAGKSGRDAESLAPLVWGDLSAGQFVAFENRHRIVRYRTKAGRFGSSVRSLKLPRAVMSLKGNQGLEGIEVLAAGPHKGALVAFAERADDGDGYALGWIFQRGRAAPFGIKRLDGFDITGLAALPGGGLLVLERKFTGILGGIYMRVRRLTTDEIRPGARVPGEILFTSDRRHFIDNMEAIAVHNAPSGETIITVMSDDNFNPFQRTLLMQFALK